MWDMWYSRLKDGMDILKLLNMNILKETRSLKRWNEDESYKYRPPIPE